MNGLRVDLFDGLRLFYGGEQLQRFRTQKSASLLALLAYFPDRLHTREELLERFWPDCDPDTARSRLSSTLWQVRRHLADVGAPDETLLRADREALVLHSAALTTDVVDFQRALDTARAAPNPVERRAALAVALDL